MTRRCKFLFLVAVLLVLYAGVLLMPACMGQVVDKSQGSFAGNMTSLGGRAVRLRAAQTLDWVHSAIKRGYLAVCEIGPGRGVVAGEVDRRGDLYFAIDCDPAAIARVKHLALDAWVARVPPMPDSLPPMNAFVCENVLEHMSGYQEAHDLLAGFYEKLGPNGCVVVRFPEIHYAGAGFWDGAQDHQYVTSLRRVAMLCRECGFEIDRCGYAFDNMIGATGWAAYQVKRLFPWRLMHGLLYEPWQTSPYSTLADKVPHAYVVAVKQGVKP